MNQQYNIISLGAGVQSSCMALMAAKKWLEPMPDFAVFADTGDEPQAVHDYLAYLIPLLPFPVRIVQKSVLSEHLFEWGHSQIPAFMIGASGKAVIGKRQCTNHWKIRPIHRHIRQSTGLARKRVEPGTFIIWQGISMDEIQRMAMSRHPSIVHRFPLIERKMSRNDCMRWLSENGYKLPPKSACVYCPYKRNDQWQAFKEAGGPEWDKIVKVDRLLNERGEFLHPACKPIDQIDFVKPKAQIGEWTQISMLDECSGMCGV